MRGWTLWMAPLLIVGTVVAARAPEPDACSTRRLMGARSSLFMLATARHDTLRAGPGPIRYNSGDTTGLENIHGQRFRIDGLGGDVPAELAGASEAVLVPYGSACRETYAWRDKARWAEPGSQVLVDLVLRPREQWVGGIPTFDVEMEHGRYPEGYTLALDSVPDEMLTPAQVFELNRVLPTWEAVEAAPDSAYRSLFAWARSNPRLAARFPATAALAEANEWLQPCRPAYDPHPVAGTYRATVMVGASDTLTTYLRTHASGYSLCGPLLPPLDEAVLRPQLADSARLYVYGAPDTALILATNAAASAGGGRCGAGMFDVQNRSVLSEDGLRSWEADFNDAMLPSCFPDEPEVRRASQAIYAAYVADPRANLPGRFRETPGGGMTFEQTWRANGRVVLHLTATRVSPRTLPEWGR